MAGDRMPGQRFGRTQARSVWLACSLLLCAMPLAAGLLTTERTLADFTFVGEDLDYFHDPEGRALSVDSAMAVPVTDPNLGDGSADRAPEPLGGSLHLGARTDRFGDFRGADFNAFGSLPALATRPAAALLNDSVKAESPGTRLGGLECLFERDRISGPLVGQYRLVGIFALAAGVDEVTWVQGFADGAAALRLLHAEDAGTGSPGEIKAIPAPDTLGLLASGLFLLWRRRRANAAQSANRQSRTESPAITGSARQSRSTWPRQTGSRQPLIFRKKTWH